MNIFKKWFWTKLYKFKYRMVDEDVCCCGSSNCDGFAMLNIGIQDYHGKTIKSYLEEKKIKTLRIYTNDSFVQVNFSEANQDKLINTLKCIE